jgi:hypothetical protein
VRRHDAVTEPLHRPPVALPDLLLYEPAQVCRESRRCLVASFLGEPRVAREVEERERRRTLGPFIQAHRLDRAFQVLHPIVRPHPLLLAG